MVEKTLERIIEDYGYIDHRFGFLGETDLNFTKGKIEKVIESSKDLSADKEGFDRFLRMLQDAVAGFLYKEGEYQSISIDECDTWRKADKIARELFSSKKLDDFYHLSEIEDINSELDQYGSLIKITLLYLGADYLFQNREDTQEKYGERYIRNVLEKGWSKELTSVDFIEDPYSQYYQDYSEALDHLYHSKNKSDSVKKLVVKTARAIYDRTRDNVTDRAFISSIGGVKEKRDTESLEDRYSFYSEPLSFNPYVIKRQPYLFNYETISYINRIYSGNEKGMNCFLKTIPILLFDVDKDLPEGAYTKLGRLTFDRILDICKKQDAYGQFPLSALESVTDIHDRDQLWKINNILNDWACEDLLHMIRLERAIERFLTYAEKINRNNSGDFSCRASEDRLLRLSSLIYYAPAVSVMDFAPYDKIAEAIVNGQDIPVSDLYRVFSRNTVIFPTYLAICTQLLYTSHGQLKGKDDIKSIVEDLVGEVLKDPYKLDSSGHWDRDSNAKGNTYNRWYSIKSKAEVYFNPHCTDRSVSEVTRRIIRLDQNLTGKLTIMDANRLQVGSRRTNIVTGEESNAMPDSSAISLVKYLADTFLRESIEFFNELDDLR